jgi:hypothetical protein
MVAIPPAFAVCHAVTPAGSGSKSGANWSNAFAGLPAKLVRGDIYYLGDGGYPGYSFSTPPSGTSRIEIRKAQSYDHCNGTGWDPGTMGSLQAVFQFAQAEPVIAVGTSYVTIDGNGRSTAAGCGGAGAAGTNRTQSPPKPVDCGIKIDNSTCTSAAPDACDSPIKIAEANVRHLTLKHVEALGTGNNSAETMMIFAPYEGDGDERYEHLYMHNAGCVYIQNGQRDGTVSDSYFWGNRTASAGCHGQASFSSGAESNTTYAGNVFRDISGTAIWTFAANSTIHDGWNFYNNVIWNDTQAEGELEDGIIACINPETVCTNFMVVQNTMVNLNYSTGTVFSNAGGSISFLNNLWYLNQGNDGTPGGVAFAMAGSTLIEDYNSILRSSSRLLGSGVHDVNDGAAPDPFVNWKGGNFNLAAENKDWTNRLGLSSPFTTDANGRTRTTDRGAYQNPPSADAAGGPATSQ